MKNFRIPLRVVFYREYGRWVAHCLEFDIAGSGDDKADAISDLNIAIGIQLHETVDYGNPKNLFSPADGNVFRMFAEGKDSDVLTGELIVAVDGLSIDSVVAREYDDDLVPA